MNILAAGRSAAARAQSLSLRAAAATAVVPTAQEAQGMVMVGHDALSLPPAFAVALAAFLELALISSALLARACPGGCGSAQRCRRGSGPGNPAGSGRRAQGRGL